jgi:glycosyltransferase involved in cell wall biosynthesis
MQILSVCNKPPFPSIDGGTLAMASMIKSMLKTGAQVTCVFFTTHKHPYIEKDVEEEIRNRVKLIPIQLNTKISISGAIKNLLSGESYHLSRFNHRSVHELLSDLLLQNQFNLIQLESLFTLPYLETIRQYSKAPVIYRAHNIETEIWEKLACEISNPFKKIYLHIQINRLRKFENSIIQKVDGILAISNQDEKALRDKLKTDIPVNTISFGLDDKYFQKENEKPSKGIPGFFYIGAMDWMPNIESVQWLLGKVWPEVMKKNHEVKLKIAGKQMPEDMRKYENKQVEISGQVADAIVFMRENDIMLAPLFSGSGIRIKILEAMALGKTVITTSTGAMGIEGKHRENILIADDREAFIREIAYCIENRKAAAEIGMNAREFILKNYSINSISEQLKKYYQLFV